MKHKHYDMIVAWASGKDIQFKAFSDSDWEDVDMTGEEWYEHYTYRIKPEPKPDVVKYLIRGFLSHSSWREFDNQKGHEADGCIKITFDGETGKLKSAEVL